LPFHLDRTGVKVMALCPGVTETALFSRTQDPQFQEEWLDEVVRVFDELPKQK
jgi:short-subunit dehydrogenase